MAEINLDDATLRAAQATDRFPVKSANGETVEATTAQDIANLAVQTSITIGSTTTGDAGTNASVTNTGTATAPILNFTIPRGEQGIPGSGGSGSSYAPIFYNFQHPRVGWNDDNCFRVLFVGNSNIQSGLQDVQLFLDDLGVDRNRYSMYFVMKGGGSTDEFVEVAEAGGTELLWHMPTTGGGTTTGTLVHNTQNRLVDILANPWDLIVYQLGRSEVVDYSFARHLKTLIGYAKENCINQNVCIAVAQSFVIESIDQTSNERFNLSVQSINRQLNEIGVDFVIPLGTSYQNARNTTGLQTAGDLLSDGIHVTTGIGEYIQTGTIVQSIFAPVFNFKFANNNVNLDGDVPTTIENKALANRCIQNALNDRTTIQPAEGGIAPADRYTVTYNGNGNTSGSVTDSNEYLSGTTVTVANNNYSRTGYAFASFNTAQDGSGTTYAPTNTFIITSDVTLYAIWTEIPQGQFVVTYNANQGTGSMIDSNTYVPNATVTVLTNAFTRVGYNFTSFNTAIDGTGTSYAAGSTFTITDNITLYATWAEIQPVEGQAISFSGSANMNNSNFRIIAQLFNASGEELTTFEPEATTWRWRTDVEITSFGVFFSSGVPMTSIELSEIPSGITNLSGFVTNNNTITRLLIRTFTNTGGADITSLGTLARGAELVNYVTMPLLGSIGTSGAFDGNTGFTSVAEGIVNADGTISSPSEGVFPSQLYADNMGFVNI